MMMDDFSLELEWAIISTWSATRREGAGIPANINSASAYVTFRKEQQAQRDAEKAQAAQDALEASENK